MMSSVSVLPGISYHKVGVGQINCPKYRIVNLEPRNVYVYTQGNYEAMADELFNYFTESQELSLSLDIHSLWNMFKVKLLSFTSKYVPCRGLSNQRLKNRPFVSRHLRRLINNKRGAYTNCRKNCSPGNRLRLILRNEYRNEAATAKSKIR